MAATDAPINTLGPTGFIRQWLLLGPFPSQRIENPAGEVIGRTGFNTDFLLTLGGESVARITPETTFKFRAPSGARKIVRAYPYHSFEDGHLCDRSLDGCVGYAFCFVDAEKDEQAFVYFGSDGSPKVWINGELVFSNYRRGHATIPWEYGARINLRKGQNPVLIKLDNDRGWWGFQTEWYRQSDHAIGFERKFSGLKLRSREAGDSLEVIVDSIPTPQGLSVPVNVELQLLDHKVIATGSGNTGQKIHLKASQPIRGVVEVVMSSGTGAPKAVRDQASRYVGDFAAMSAQLADRLATVRAAGNMPPQWRSAYEPVFLFLENFLTAHIGEPDESDISNFVYAQNVVSALERHENYLATHAGDEIPAAYPRVATSPAAETQYTYVIQLPQSFVPGKVAYPLSIFLHGSGGIGQKAVYRAIKDPQSNLSSAGVPYVSVRPLSGKTFWHIDALNRMLAQIKLAFSIDADRVYLAGHSMGGMATWQWATENPELFAAIEPIAGYGDPLRVARLANVPVIAFQGEQDTSVLPYRIERTISALRAAKGTVLYTLDPNAGHTVRTDAVDVTGFFNKYTRSGNRPADPMDALGLNNGISPPVLRDIPRQTCLAVTRSAIPEDLAMAINAAQAELYNLQRAGGYLAAGNVIYRDIGTPDDDAAQSFDLLLPIDRKIATKGDVRIETIPAVKAWCFYVNGSRTQVDARIADAGTRAIASGLKLAPNGEIRRVQLSDGEFYGEARYVCEIQMILAN